MARYKEAIAWMAENDDVEWVYGPEGTADATPSVTASLVADLFNKPEEQVRDDIRTYLRRHS